MPADLTAGAAQYLRELPETAHMVAPDAMIAAAAHVEREYGVSGYQIGLAWSDWSGAGCFDVRASDGARFRLYVDRYGNVTRVPDAA